MNSEVIEELEEQEETLDIGPGQLLSQKREVLGLSVQEVADKLHITMHYVRALESDAHDKLPGDVFIKGYLRSYSNLLGLEPSIVINVYNEYTNQRESAELESNTRRRRRNKNMPWIIVSGIAFVAMAVALWYFGTSSADIEQRSASSAAPAPASAARSAGAADATLANIATTRQVPSAPSAPVPVNDETALSSIDNDAAELEELAAPVVEAVVETAQQSVEAVEEAISDVVAEDLAPVVEQVAEPQIPERLITIEGEGDDTVQIRFSGESMVQVDDANDVQLYRDVRVAGDVLRISGTAPFNILLGDASNSQLSLNGDEIDFRSSIRIDNSARLTIGL